jgi:hypothetical protein
MQIVDSAPVGVPLVKWEVESEEEAREICGNFPAYLVKSKIINQYYLFIPVKAGW